MLHVLHAASGGPALALGLGPASLKRGLACHGHSGRDGCCPDAAARLVLPRQAQSPRCRLSATCYMLHATAGTGSHGDSGRCGSAPVVCYQPVLTARRRLQTAVDTRLRTIASCGAQLGMGPRALLAASRPRPRTWGRAPATTLPPPCFAVFAPHLLYLLEPRCSCRRGTKSSQC